MAHSLLFASLDDYLRTALEVLANWGQWLAEQERLVLDADVLAMEAHAASAAMLQQDLQNLQARRTRLLEEAAAAGYSCANLKQLAQALPEWIRDSSFRDRVRSVEHSMHSLRRLNLAAWLLVSQCARTVDDTLLLMTCGSTLIGAYVEVPQADTSGGQILDAEV
jgi:flagellar biosynthesis/type III secretory pathway chaperone